LTFVYFDETDVVRHHLVQRIIRAYDEHKARVAEEQTSVLESKANGKTNGAAAVPQESNPMPSAGAETAVETNE
jgi:hypothetical protein